MRGLVRQTAASTRASRYPELQWRDIWYFEEADTLCFQRRKGGVVHTFGRLCAHNARAHTNKVPVPL